MHDLISTCRQRAKAALGATPAQLEHGLELHRDSFVCDLFAFSPSAPSRGGIEHINEVIREGGRSDEVLEASEDAARVGPVCDPDTRQAFADVLETAGVDCLVSTVGLGPTMRRGLRNVARFTYLCDSMEGIIGKAASAEAVERMHARGERCFVWSANNPPCMGPFEDGYDLLRWLDTYYYLGIRMMHLTYNRRNWVGDGCTEPTDAGLSDFGHEIVARLNDRGVIVDTPHSGKQTTLDAIRASRAPVFASHTGCEGVFQHPRCKSDEELKAIADSGGVIGIYILPGLLGDPSHVSIRTLLEHIDYAVELVGPDHVMIGSDSTFSIPPPAGVEREAGPKARRNWWALWGPEDLKGDPNREGSEGSLSWINWPLFTAGLVTLGYSDDNIRKIIGGNFLRAMKGVQACAADRFRQ
ncbi:MAG: dipeptidase [Lentisphaerae bacterium]|jgi:membrane dipeptidase|nr:dipeptidase [Lentisphaerota bacterium]MBT4819988.1 dipeptidase [Lentisphaerota bacterium]MBT5604865.1 dipeptidase [Lentisphaerota bacterium]MBT7054216.1 dipeptidase [Lentisphaerota bacterium]MBT7841013.1 dipeptidase [Lentisphaerota bacterium]